MRRAYVHLILEAFQPWRELKANSALGPLAVLHNHILGDEGDRCGPANELVLFRARLWRDEREVRSAVGRGHGYETPVRLNARVKNQLKPKLIEVKVQAEVEIANVNGHRLQAQVRILPVQTDC